MSIHVDARSAPWVRIAYIGDYSDDELEAYLALLGKVLAVPGPRIGLIDLTRATLPTASQRRRTAAFIEEHDAILHRDFRACAVVLDNVLMRGAVTAVFWMRPLPLPTEIFATLAQATAWLEPHRRACLGLPPA